MNNFYDQFAASAERFPERTAVEVQRRDQLERLTYAELRAMADRAAELLTTRGIARGDCCAILADNDARWCAAYFGVLRLGAVAVPLDTAYKPQQIAALVRDCGPRILFTTPKYLSAALEAARACQRPPEVFLLHGSAETIASFDEVLARRAPPGGRHMPPCPARAADPAVVLYTSGTTSDPKGVVLTHGNLLAEMEAVFQVVQVDERDAILGVLPLFHALAQLANLLLPFAVGARVIFLETLNTTELLRALRERGATIFCCVPQFFYLIHQRVTAEVSKAGRGRRLAFRALLALNGWLRESAGVNLGPRLFGRVHDVLGREMRLLVTGGSRFDPAIAGDLYRLGFQLVQAYGLTESSGAATVTPPGGICTDSVGAPLPGIEVKILPARTRPDEGVSDGEILLRGPIVMQGYFNRPDANAEAIRDGWMHTGDLGYLDASGELHITGRSKDVIVLSSGKNIYPEEIEAHYLQSPYIKELCVLGRQRPGEPAAERLHAVVVPDFEVMKERKVLNAREILRFEIENLSIQLPSHKRILSYEIWTEELPRTTTRKLQRYQIERRAGAREAVGAPAQLSEADRAWAARPEVASALELVREAAKQAGAIRPDANIELELGLDSIERVELLARLEQRFSTTVPDEAAHRIYTVRELVEAVLPRTAGPSEGQPLGVAPAGAAAHRDAWGTLLAASREDDSEFAALLLPRPVFAAVTFVVVKLCYALAWPLLRFRVTGCENLPPQGPFLLCPNHQSYLDPFLLVSALPFRVFRDVFFVGASEYFATPFTRWFARKSNIVPVDPDTNLLRAMAAGAFGLRHGKVLILFPEGERSIDGEPKKFKKGAPILSLHLGAPIVPVALDGAFDFWPRGRSPRWAAYLPGSGKRARMRFGAPLAPPAALPPDASLAQAESHYAAAADELRAIILDMWTPLRQS